MALEDKEIMVDTDELEPLPESEKEEEEDAEEEPDPVKDPGVDPMKELELEEDDKGPEKTGKEEQRQEDGEPPKAQLSREGSLSLKSPSAEEERSATRTLIRQPSPVVETSDGEEHDQVYFVYDIPKYFLLGNDHSFSNHFGSPISILPLSNNTF